MGRLVTLPDDVPRPAYLWIPPHVDTAGPEVADFASALGYTLDPLQRFLIDLMYAEGEDGLLAAPEFAEVACRQNLKSYTLEPSALYDALVLNTWVAWTAHRMRTTRKVYQRVVDLIDSHDWLSRRVKAHRVSDGSPEFEFVGGGGMQFLARTINGIRGLSSRVLIVDEALFATGPMMGSTAPVIAAQHNPQIRYAGSAGKADSHLWRAIRDRGRRGGDPELAYVELGAPEPLSCAEAACRHTIGTPGCALDDEERLRRANPAVHYGRITIRNLRTLRKTIPDPREYARECHGLWDDPTGAAAISADLWAARLDPASRPSTAPRFGLDVGPRSAWAALAAAAYRPDRLVHVEITSRTDKVSGERLVDHRQGVEWVIPRLLALQSSWSEFRVAIASGSPAEALKPDIEAAGIPVDVVTKVNAACGLFFNKVKSDQLRHIGQKPLDAAVANARRLEHGESGAFRWGRVDVDEDLTPIYAASLAAYQLAGDEDTEVAVYGADLQMCDRCGKHPHEDPDGEHDYVCPKCRDDDDEEA